jgi:exodeoxyribonuclease V alpha subunit
MTQLFAKLGTSRFRARFRLSDRDRAYIAEKGLAVISVHALDFIRSRLAPAGIPNDGRQTPFRGHPVFIAQHASATCCRKCLHAWHRIARDRQLDEDEIRYVHDVIMAWMQRQLA